MLLPLLLAAGCAGVGPEGQTATGGGATLELRPTFVDGTYRTQEVIAPNTAADVNHILVKLCTVSDGGATSSVMIGGNPVQVDIPGASVSAPVKLGNLRRNTTYRVQGFAYRASGSAPGDQISVDSGSFVDVPVGSDDRPTVASLPIRLADRSFGGQATGSMTVTGGTVVGAGTETLGAIGLPDPVTVLATVSNASEISFDGDGNGYVTDRTGGPYGTAKVYKVAPDGMVAEFPPPEYRQIMGLAAGKAGIFASEYGMGGKYKFAGAWTEIYDHCGGVSSYDMATIAVGPTGLMYGAPALSGGYAKLVARTNKRTYTYQDPGCSDTKVADGFIAVAGVAVTGDSTVYVSDYGDNKVYRVAGEKTVLAGSGTYAETDGTGAAAAFKRPWGLAVDEAGNVFVADAEGPAIRRITPSGVVTTLPLGIALTKPRGLAFDPSGNLAVVDNADGTVWKIPRWMTMVP